MLLSFILMCLMSTAFVLILGLIVTGRRKTPAAVPPDLLPFYVSVLAGALLITLALYWRAFGVPSRHPELPFVAEIGALCAYGAGFWIARHSLGRLLADFVAANGGTASEAFTSLLLHPGRSLLRVREQRLRQGTSADEPAP